MAEKAKNSSQPPEDTEKAALVVERQALLDEIAALKRRLASGGQYQAAPAAVPAAPPGDNRPRKLWQVSFDHVHKGLITPSLWFVKEKPGDPRGQPIEAATEAEAKGIFCALHGIEGWTGQGPEAWELTPEQAQALTTLPVEEKKTPGPSRPQRPQPPKTPTAARDAALADVLTF